MILDTNAVSALLAGDKGLASVLAGEPRHHLPAVVVGEYRYGLLRSARRKRIQPWFDRLEQESTVLAIDERTARAYAVVREGLRAKGRPMPENDVWIAALAVQYRLPVVTRDEHFDEVDGLTRLGW